MSAYATKLLGRLGGIADRAIGGIAWNPSLHPRDENGRFVDTPDVALPDGGRGRALSQRGDKVTVEKPDGSTVDVPAAQVRDLTEQTGSAAAPDRRMVDALIAKAEAGGFTVDRSGVDVKSGYAVAQEGQGEHFPVADAPARVAAYLAAHPGANHLGGWYDRESGEVWLDTPEVVQTEDEAIGLARERGEIAVADLAAFARGDDGEIRVPYATRPPRGPAHDQWDMPGVVLKEGGDGRDREAGADRAEAGGDGRGVRGEVPRGPGDAGAAPDSPEVDPREQAVAEQRARAIARADDRATRSLTNRNGPEGRRTLFGMGERVQVPATGQHRDADGRPITEGDTYTIRGEEWTVTAVEEVRGGQGLSPRVEWSKDDSGVSHGVSVALRNGDGKVRIVSPARLRGSTSAPPTYPDPSDMNTSDLADALLAARRAQQDPKYRPWPAQVAWWGDVRAEQERRQRHADALRDQALAEGEVRVRRERLLTDAVTELASIPREGRPDASGDVEDPIDCGDDVEKAARLLGEGKHVRLNQPDEVATLLDEVYKIVQDAKEQWGADYKKHLPTYDLCRVHVPKTNLFCEESKGIDRDRMPQLKGTPVKGSYADDKARLAGPPTDPHLPKTSVEPEFAELLTRMGIVVHDEVVPASHLRATQDQLDAANVAGLVRAIHEGKLKDSAIYVTRDGYIIDGHHRWAAKIAVDMEDEDFDVQMPVHVIDADIGYMIDLTNGFTRMAGITPKGVDHNPPSDRSAK